MIEIPAISELVYFAVLVLGAGLLVRSGLVKMNKNEASDLAITRGERIDDLKREMSDLRREMRRLEAKLQVIEEMRTEEIVQGVIPGVVEGIRPFLTEGRT